VKKGVTFGFGKTAADISPRLLKRAGEPGPCHYRFNSSTFGAENKGRTFGAGREAYKKVYIKSNPPVKGWTEPGKYNIDSFIEISARTSKRWFFGKRLESHGEDKAILKFPGPGYYEN